VTALPVHVECQVVHAGHHLTVCGKLPGGGALLVDSDSGGVTVATWYPSVQAASAALFDHPRGIPVTAPSTGDPK
jgi:hypothetical protein